jgi:glycine hydroxymethyltransferase
VDPETEQIDYDSVEQLAREHKPKFIIAGYSSYPWAVDWAKFRKIADVVGAILFADIAHVAGLVVAGAYPSPVGYADVISFTTHKSLCGPRGACILVTDEKLSIDIDRAVFPGEQGGPHVNSYAGMAVAFKLAMTEQFHQLQQQVVKNCIVFTDRLSKRGFRIPYGGTDTHLMNLACNTIVGEDGTGLSGDIASRILDIAGIVVNRNTIPGDLDAADPSGIRMGTPWLTQRGFLEKDMEQLADVIADILQATYPHSRPGFAGKLRRSKVEFDVLEIAKIRVREMATRAGIDFEPTHHGYPHFYYVDREPPKEEWVVLALSGDRVRLFLNQALTNDLEVLGEGESQPTRIHTPHGEVDCSLSYIGPYCYHLSVPASKAVMVAAWLRDLADGYVKFDEDVVKKLPGLTEVEFTDEEPVIIDGERYAGYKPYFLGMDDCEYLGDALPEFKWEEKEGKLRRTPMYDTHVKLGAKIIPFAGWEMPVWFTSVLDEHLAVRETAGLFDVAHMGVYQVEGPDAAAFLDSVIANDASYLSVGESCYTHFLDPDVNVLDDLLVYRRGKEKYLVVVNAANDDKNWTWLNAVKEGRVLIDRKRPCARVYGRNATLRNLKAPKAGEDMRVDVGLQGPQSRKILLAMDSDEATQSRIRSLNRTEICEVNVGGFELIISRTGYTGERLSFELFVHPDKADALFNRLLEVGKQFGLKPCGLGARDSLRTEAGLPLYGNEMGGELNLGVGEAGFSAYIMIYKAWFIGRDAFIENEKRREKEVVRFRFVDKGIRMAHLSDPVVDKRGRVIGSVTSCAIDKEGYLTGQAVVDFKNSKRGTPLFIYQNAHRGGRDLRQVEVGDRVIIPAVAEVVRRYPMLENSRPRDEGD